MKAEHSVEGKQGRCFGCIDEERIRKIDGQCMLGHMEV
jgi:hypothetical protein